MRHRYRLAAVLVVVLATISLLSQPASANDVFVDVQGGDLHIYDENGDLFDTIDLAGGVECAPAVRRWRFSFGILSGSASHTTTTDEARNIGGTNYRVRTTMSGSGGWTLVPPATNQSGSIGPIAMIPTTGPGSCTPVAGAGWCTIQAGNVAFNGSVTAAGTMPTLATGDVITISGGNSLGDNVVSGLSSNCGVAIAANNGYLALTGMTLVVV